MSVKKPERVEFIRIPDYTGSLSEVFEWMTEQENKRAEFEGNRNIRFDISVHRENRSLRANSYAWLLCGKIAEELGCSKDEAYKELLKSYGQSRLLELPEELTDTEIRKLFKYVDILDTSNGRKTVKVYINSSYYDSKEMALFISGIVSACADMGINILSKSEIDTMKETWDEQT